MKSLQQTEEVVPLRTLCASEDTEAEGSFPDHTARTLKSLEPELSCLPGTVLAGLGPVSSQENYSCYAM